MKPSVLELTSAMTWALVIAVLSSNLLESLNSELRYYLIVDASLLLIVSLLLPVFRWIANFSTKKVT